MMIVPRKAYTISQMMNCLSPFTARRANQNLKFVLQQLWINRSSADVTTNPRCLMTLHVESKSKYNQSAGII